MCAGPMTRDDTAFMGFYAVDPRYQGIGVGRELWAKTVERLDSGKNIGLYGVPAMSAKYKKSGFKIEDSIRMLIYESRLTNDESGGQKHELFPERLKALESQSLVQSTIRNNKWLLIGSQTLKDINERDLFDQLVKYDEHVNRFSRRDLLSNYLLGDDTPLTVIMLLPVVREQKYSHCQSQAEKRIAGSESGVLSHKPQGQSCCQLESARTSDQGHEDDALSTNVQHSLSISPIVRQDGLDEHYKIVGYGCARHDNTGGGMIGPLYASSDDYCEIILRQLIGHFPLQSGGKYSVMSLTSNSAASYILEKIGFHQMDQCSRMFTKFAPEASLSHVYFVHSPNFTLF